MCCLHTQYIFLFFLIGHSALYPFLDFINNHYLGNKENIIFFIKKFFYLKQNFSLAWLIVGLSAVLIPSCHLGTCLRENIKV